MKKRVLELLIVALCMGLCACGYREAAPAVQVRRFVCLGQDAAGDTVMQYVFRNPSEKTIAAITFDVVFPEEGDTAYPCTVTGPCRPGQSLHGTVRVRPPIRGKRPAAWITAMEITYTDGTAVTLDNKQMKWIQNRPDAGH